MRVVHEALADPEQKGGDVVEESGGNTTAMPQLPEIVQTTGSADWGFGVGSSPPSPTQQFSPQVPPHTQEAGVLLPRPESQLQEALQERDRFKQLWKQAARDLNKLQADHTIKIDDDYIVSAWRTLQYEIRIFAAQHFGDGKDGVKLRKQARPRDSLVRLVRDAKGYLQTSALRPLLVQAFIWDQLARRIFSASEPDNGLLWAGAQHGPLRSLSAALTPGNPIDSGRSSAYKDWKTYMRWRSATADLMKEYGTSAETDRLARTVVDSMVDVLATYVTSKRDDFRHTLTTIIQRAVRLDYEFHTQRARFQVSSPTNPQGLPYDYWPDPDVVDHNGGELAHNDHSKVQLTISPILHKIGNSDGEHYDQHVVLCKAQVSVHPPTSTDQSAPRNEESEELSHGLGMSMANTDIVQSQHRKQSTSTQGSTSSSTGRRPSDGWNLSRFGVGSRKMVSEPEAITALPDIQPTSSKAT